MEIRILTFHRAKNYGAMLQCYALMWYLQKCGHNVKVFDYCPSYLAGLNDRGIISSIKKILRFIVYHTISKGEVRHIDAFEYFVNMHIKPVSFVKDMDVDAIVCGSDQIWSTNICGGFDPMYFASFAVGYNSKIVSYAASNGNSSISHDDAILFKKLLRNFHYISVREQNLCNLLQKWNFKAELVLDPVLLVGREAFDDILEPIKQVRSYVLVYEIQHSENTYILAEKMARTISADIIVVGGGFRTYFKKGVYNKQGLTPTQFVHYFKNASCVITTSFHGTAFSIIYSKPFYSVATHTDKDERITSLLHTMGLYSRYVKDVQTVEYSDIDYKNVDPLLNAQRRVSINFLQNSLNLSDEKIYSRRTSMADSMFDTDE